MMLKQVLLFAAGVAVGAVLAMRLTEKKYAEKFDDEVNRRIDEIEEEKAEKEKEEESQKTETVLKEKMQYNKLTNDYVEHGDKEKRKEADVKEDYLNDEYEEDDDDAAEYEHPEDDEEVAEYPYQITESDFNDNVSKQWQQETLYFFKGDGTLLNDDDKVLDDDGGDITMMLGNHWMDTLMSQPRGELYIRNEKLDTEYEIDISEGNYPLS